MSNPVVLGAFDTGRPVKFHFRMKIPNPREFWYCNHASNVHIEHQMGLFKDSCEKLLTEQMPKGTFVWHDTETCWRYGTKSFKAEKANCTAVLQCSYVTVDDVVEHVHALAPDDTIPMVIDNHEYEVEVLWPDCEQQYVIDLWDEQESIPILDQRFAKAALEAAGLQPTKLKHATDLCGTTTMPLSTWIATFEMNAVKTIQPIRFMFGERDLSIQFSQRTD